MLEIKFDRGKEVGMEKLREGTQVEAFTWKGEGWREVQMRWSYYG